MSLIRQNPLIKDESCGKQKTAANNVETTTKLTLRHHQTGANAGDFEDGR